MDKTSGLLPADKVNMVTMTVKVDTGCTELALPKSLVQKLKLAYVDTVLVSSSTDKNVPTERYGLVIIW
jgi:predicted aspartyl protease